MSHIKYKTPNGKVAGITTGITNVAKTMCILIHSKCIVLSVVSK